MAIELTENERFETEERLTDDKPINVDTHLSVAFQAAAYDFARGLLTISFLCVTTTCIGTLALCRLLNHLFNSLGPNADSNHERRKH